MRKEFTLFRFLDFIWIYFNFDSLRNLIFVMTSCLIIWSEFCLN